MRRRDFLKITGAGFIAAPWLISPLPAETGRSRVIRVRDTGFHAPEPRRIREMLDLALSKLADGGSARDVWRSLFTPEDTVGIKVNCLAGRGMSTNPELVEAIAGALSEAGVPPRQVIVWDRNDRDLKAAGYRISRRGGSYRCFGTDEVGFARDLYEEGSVGSLVSKIQAQMCTAVVNVPVLKDHGITGITASLKNYYGAIHNPNKYHPNGGDPYIADLNAMDVVRRKERLVIIDALSAQYNGGPAYAPAWSWQEGSLIVSRDPVAADFTAFLLISNKRREKGLPSLAEEKRHPRHIFTAARVRCLGRASLEEIDLVEVEL